MFKRSPSLTEQTKLYIKERILNNEFADGRIPSETELANTLGVSRTTVRDALSKLENEGVITRKQGVGTFINQPGLQVRTRLEEVWSYEEVLRAHGYTPSVQMLNMILEPADAGSARTLELDDGEQVLYIEKLFLEDSTPVILTRNAVPASLIQCDYDETLARRPIYDFLESCCQRHLSYYLSEIVPVVADDQLAHRLGIQPGVAVLLFEETGYDVNNQPIVRALSWFRDDLLRFRLIRRRVGM